MGQGPVIAFNVLRADGSHLGHRELETLSGASGLVLRTGCHCNPGACSLHLGLTPAETKANFESGHVCWDDRDVINGKPTGCVRISFGYMSTFEDAAAFLSFLEKTCVETAPRGRNGDERISNLKSERELVLKGVFVYPIKSCQGFAAVGSWPIVRGSLYLDRQWAVADEAGQILSQKREPRLAQIETLVDLEGRTLRLAAPGRPRVEARLADDGAVADGEAAGLGRWLGALLGKPCQLVCCSASGSNGKVSGKSGGNFSNQGGYFLVST